MMGILIACCYAICFIQFSDFDIWILEQNKQVQFQSGLMIFCWIAISSVTFNPNLFIENPDWGDSSSIVLWKEKKQLLGYYALAIWTPLTIYIYWWWKKKKRNF